MVPGGGKRADAVVAEEVGQTGNGGEAGRDEGRCQKIERSCAPPRASRPPEDHIANKGGDQECHGERNEHWMQRVPSNLEGAPGIARDHYFPPRRRRATWLDAAGVKRFPLSAVARVAPLVIKRVSAAATPRPAAAAIARATDAEVLIAPPFERAVNRPRALKLPSTGTNRLPGLGTAGSSDICPSQARRAVTRSRSAGASIVPMTAWMVGTPTQSSRGAFCEALKIASAATSGS